MGVEASITIPIFSIEEAIQRGYTQNEINEWLSTKTFIPPHKINKNIEISNQLKKYQLKLQKNKKLEPTDAEHVRQLGKIIILHKNNIILHNNNIILYNNNIINYFLDIMKIKSFLLT